MDYRSIKPEDISFLRNAQLLMKQRGLNEGSIKGIVVDPKRIIARSPDTGVVVSEGTVDNRRVRVVTSEKEATGGSEDHPLVISTIVLEDASPE